MVSASHHSIPFNDLISSWSCILVVPVKKSHCHTRIAVEEETRVSGVQSASAGGTLSTQQALKS